MNEIDIVAVNDVLKKLFIAEEKLNPTINNIEVLKRKSMKLIIVIKGIRLSLPV